jgi:hypothetical protein
MSLLLPQPVEGWDYRCGLSRPYLENIIFLKMSMNSHTEEIDLPQTSLMTFITV